MFHHQLDIFRLAQSLLPEFVAKTRRDVENASYSDPGLCCEREMIPEKRFRVILESCLIEKGIFFFADILWVSEKPMRMNKSTNRLVDLSAYRIHSGG